MAPRKAPLGALRAILASALAARALAGWNAQARTPPMAWRSWNQYGCNISQPDIVANARALADTSRLVNGVPTSLAQLGYITAGLDDCYQELLDPSCVYPGFGDAPLFEVAAAPDAAAAPKGPPYTQHDANGRPVVNRTRFPDLLEMTTQIHALGLQAGFYQSACAHREDRASRSSRSANSRCTLPQLARARSHTLTAASHRHSHRRAPPPLAADNCFCRDHCGSPECYLGDTDALLDSDFDSVKYDGCGAADGNLTFYGTLLNNSAKAANMIMENCNNDNGPDGNTPLDQLPFHLYRTSYDIRPTYGSIVSNAQTVFGNTAAVSGPSCWAYPDMLEVRKIRFLALPLAAAISTRSFFPRPGWRDRAGADCARACAARARGGGCARPG